MTDITSVQAAPASGGVAVSRSPRVDAPALPAPVSDRLEISDVGQRLSTLQTEQATPIRAPKVAEIREAIANGTYETDDKIEYVISRLLNVLNPPADSTED